MCISNFSKDLNCIDVLLYLSIYIYIYNIHLCCVKCLCLMSWTSVTMTTVFRSGASLSAWLMCWHCNLEIRMCVFCKLDLKLYKMIKLWYLERFIVLNSIKLAFLWCAAFFSKVLNHTVIIQFSLPLHFFLYIRTTIHFHSQVVFIHQDSHK